MGIDMGVVSLLDVEQTDVLLDFEVCSADTKEWRVDAGANANEAAGRNSKRSRLDLDRRKKCTIGAVWRNLVVLVGVWCGVGGGSLKSSDLKKNTCTKFRTWYKKVRRRTYLRKGHV